MARRNRIEFSIEARDRASAALRNTAKETNNLAGAFRNLAAGAATVLSVRQIAEYANTWRLTQNRMRLVTETTEELATVTRALVEVAAESRSSFEATANLYARVARSSRELGLSQQELIDFTETVQKSIRISGSTAAEASAGVIQFGQALASSRLSGDELRSVLEQMPRLAQAIAEGMGVGIGTLRELGEAGELTATAVLDALRRAAPEIAEEFDQLKPLVSEALAVLQSAFMIAIGTVDQASGASEKLAEFILDAAAQVRLLGDALVGELTTEGLEDITEEASLTAGAILGIAFALKTLKDGFEVTTGPISTFFTQLTSRIADVPVPMYDGEGTLEAVSIAWEDALAAALNNVDEGNEDILANFEEMMVKIRNITGTAFIRPEVDLEEGGDAIGGLTRKQRDAQARAKKSLEGLFFAASQQSEAARIAAATGKEYADVLTDVKVQALGAASGQEELARQTIFLLELYRDMGEEIEGNKFIQDLQGNLIDQAAALNLAEIAGLDYATALEIIEIRAAGVASGQMELAENLIRVFLELRERQDDLSDEFKFMENMAQRAAENMQDAFAEFFFDPFDEGLKGMLLAFINVIRTMISQSLALKTAKFFNISDFFNAFGAGLGENAAGGPAAGLTVVGERGPELLNLPRGSTVTSNSASKAMGGLGGISDATFITNIDARGADPGLIARLPGIMDQRDRQLLVAVRRFVEDGVMPV